MQEKELVTRKISAAEGADLDDDEFYQVETEEEKDKKIWADIHRRTMNVYLVVLAEALIVGFFYVWTFIQLSFASKEQKCCTKWVVN